MYAQVNRDKKRSRGAGGEPGQFDGQDYSDHAHHWAVQDNSGQTLDTSGGDRSQQQQPPAVTTPGSDQRLASEGYQDIETWSRCQLLSENHGR